MLPPDPYSIINVNADSTMRGVTLALPVDQVRRFLPAGLELGEQPITPPGTHPVTLFFNDMFQVKWSVPSLWPSLTYREHIFGIPFTFLSKGSLTPGYAGPYYYMPRLFLNDWSATLAGRFLWGFKKEIGAMNVTAGRFEVTELSGQKLTSLAWEEPKTESRLVAQMTPFVPIRRMLDQPNISLLPAGMGPIFIRSNFQRDWDRATIRPLRTAVDVDASYVPGYECGRYPASGWSPTIEESILGSYVVNTPWRLSIPYPPLLAVP